MVNWKDQGSFARLLAATVAAMEGQKLNYQLIASYYGEGATYDSIEGRFRIVKKEATKLKTEIESGTRSEAPKRGTQSNPATPRKRSTTRKGLPGDSPSGVASGRVTKSSSANSSPSKRRNLKQELANVPSSSNTTDVSSYDSGSNVHTPASMSNIYTIDMTNDQSFAEYCSTQGAMSFDDGPHTVNSHQQQTTYDHTLSYLNDPMWDDNAVV